MREILISTIFFFCSISFLKAKEDLRPIELKLQQLMQSGKKPIVIDGLFVPFSTSATKNDSILETTLSDYLQLSIQKSVLKKLLRENPELIHLKLPNYKGKSMDCLLYQESILSEDAGLSVASSDKVSVSNLKSGVHYRGVIKNASSSVVGFSFFEDDIQGLLSDEELGNITINKRDRKGNDFEYLMFADNDWIQKPYLGGCRADDLDDPLMNAEQRERPLDGLNQINTPCIRIYFECDFALFQNKGSVANTTNYVTGAFNNMAILYANEGITIRLSQVFVWTTQDSYSTISSNTALDQFKAARPTFNGNLAHLVGIGGNNLGGVAWRDVLCSNWGYAYSDIYTSYNTVPTYSWTISVLAHETGHNVGSPHTHACSWQGGALDNCYETEGSCPPGPAPTNGGTIMSYCHLTSTGINFNNGFGQQPGDLMRQSVLDASCLSICGSTCAPPNVTITGVTTLCTGQSITLTASGASNYSWSTGATGARIVVSPTVNAIYTVRGTDASGCFLDKSHSVNAWESPVLQLSSTNVTCFGLSDGTIEAIPISGSGPFSYNFGSGATSNTFLVGLAPGIYSVTVTDENGCTNRQTSSITQPSRLQALAQYTIPPCPLVPFNIAIIGAGGVQPYSGIGVYPGIYGPMTFSVVDGNLCEASISINLLPRNNDITLSIMGNRSICQGSNFTINAQGNFNSIEWSSGSNASTLVTNIPGFYHVSVTNSNGCHTNTSIQLSQFAAPIVTIQGNATICQGGLLPLIASATNASMASYIWSTGNSGSSISVNNSGTYSVTVTNELGCKGISSKEILVGLGSSLAITGTTSLCPGSQGYLSVPSISGNAYLWSNSSTNHSISLSTSGLYTVTITNVMGCQQVTTAQVQVSSQLSPAIQGDLNPCFGTTSRLSLSNTFGSYLWSNGSSNSEIITANSGVYTVTVSSNGCSGTSSVLVSFRQNANVNINKVGGHCVGDTLRLMAQTSAQNLNYIWSNGANQNSISVTADGDYVVTVVDAFQCKSTNSILVRFDSKPNITINGSRYYCQGSSTTLTAQSNGTQYFWSNNNGVNNSISSSISSFGLYTVTVVNAAGCSNSTFIRVSISEIAQPVLAFQKTICQGQTASLALLNPESFISYLWSNGSSNTSSILVSPGTYLITVIDALGCTEVQIATVVGFPTQLLNIKTKGFVCKYSKTPITLSGNFAQIMWSTGQKTKTTFISEPGTYGVEITDAYGCKNSTSFDIKSIDTLRPQIIQTGNSLCAYLENGTGQESYSWSTGAQNACIEMTNPGTYCVTMTDRGGCGASICHAHLRNRPSTFSNDQIEAAIIYPNPFNSYLNLNFVNAAWENLKSVLILNFEGKEMIKMDKLDLINHTTFDTSMLPIGVYVLKINYINDVRFYRIIKVE